MTQKIAAKCQRQGSDDDIASPQTSILSSRSLFAS